MYQLEYLDLEENNTYEEIIKKVVEQCFKEEKLEQSKLYVSITLTTPDNIHKINKQYRDVDRETDVLSFPMFEKEELEKRIQKVAAAGKLSRFKGNVFEVLENCNDYEKNLKLIKRIISMGHKSIIEHDYLVFAIF